ncbi:MAG: rhomboid family intramembrane serine protease [Armatimonadetes bacterium]|nr:rhomboid family intramembrane serine protease [Armatimonadota bacterium]
MIPLKDENPTQRVPYVLYAIVAFNVVLFLYNGTLRADYLNPLAGYMLIPREVVTGVDIGVRTPIPLWMTIFTSMFMHANILHIGGNMLYLWIFGNNIEDVLGHFKFLMFYLLSGVGAAVLHIITAPMSIVPTVGASGAIAGVLGAYFYLFPRAKIISLVFFFYYVELVALPASLVLGLWIAIQVVSSLIAPSEGGGIAYTAHVGGFLTGLLLIIVFGGKRLLRRRQSFYHPRYIRW